MPKKGFGGSGSYDTQDQLNGFILDCKERKEELAEARYTYCKDGVYYVVDVLAEQEMEFEEWELLKAV